MELEDKTDVTVAERRQFLFLHAHDGGSGYLHRSRIGLVQRTHYLQQGSLSRTAGAYYTHYFPTADGEVYSLQHLKASETFGDTLYLYHYILFVHPCSSPFLNHLYIQLDTWS